MQVGMAAQAGVWLHTAKTLGYNTDSWLKLSVCSPPEKQQISSAFYERRIQQIRRAVVFNAKLNAFGVAHFWAERKRSLEERTLRTEGR
jgi:hypothetical protein